MLDVAVNTAIGEKPENVQGGIFVLYVLDRLAERCIFFKGAVFDGFGNAGKLLIDDATGTDIEMPNFGISHLTLGKSYRKSACLEADTRISLEYFVQVRRHRCLYGIAIFCGIKSESVQYHEHRRTLCYM